MSWIALVLLQTFILVASLLAPAAAVASDPIGSPDPVAVEEPTASPPVEPSTEPAAEPAAEPTAEPTVEPTPEVVEPIAEPTAEPTAEPAAEPTSVGTPTIASDKTDYAPGETVTLTGANWAAGEAVAIFVNDTYGATWSHSATVVAGDTGTITDVFALPTWFISNYNVVATGPLSGTATTTFTDMSVDKYDQCSNDDGDGYASGDIGCRWIFGNLQSGNSTYAEGDATVQRLSLTGFQPGSTHTVTFKYGTTKGGHHAYDYLTSWNWSESWITEADRCQDIAGCVGTSEDTHPIPKDPNAEGFDSAAGSFVMRGGDLTDVSTPTLVSGSYGPGDDSETAVTVTFTVGNAGNMCTTDKQGVTTCGVALWFGAHIAKTSDWQPFNGTTGASGIQGSPYHVSLDAVDGAAAGERDNQMQSGTIVPNGTIVIVKEAVPDSATNFSFLLTNGTTITQNFQLDDDADPALPKSQTFSVPAGSYTAQELNIPAGWTLTNLVCSDPTKNSTVSLGTATASINVAAGETVTCTYTDTQGQNLTVTKTAVASYDRTYDWLIDKSVDDTLIEIAEGGTATFNYKVEVKPNGFTDSGWTLGGTVTVNNPNGFPVSGVDITDAVNVGGGASCVVTDGTNLTVPAKGSITRSYTCSFSSQPAYSGLNTGTATWPAAAGLPATSATGTAAVSFALDQETNRVITVKDDKTVFGSPVTLGTSDYYAGPYSFTYSLGKSGVAGTCTEYTNTAVIYETGQNEEVTVTVCVGKDLTVEKTAVASADRTYKWLIDKRVDKTLIEIAEGGTATFNYEVEVSPDGYTDSGWTLGGTITISNPNDWQDITLSGITDTLDQGGTCSISEAGPYVVPKGDELVLHYTCTTDGTTTENTVDITWAAATYHTPTGTASDDAPVDFALDQETNKVITVVDDKTGIAEVVLGTADWSAGSKTFTYSLTRAGVAGTCTDYTNTAFIDETAQSDKQTVTVCVGTDLTVSKTATATLDRTYKWLIDKTVDDTLIEIAEGGTATFNYDVTVTPNGYTDSGWTLGGTITITNPNDWQDITLSGVSDTLDQGGTCTISEAGPYVVPKGDTLTLHYTCTLTKATTTENTVSITWDAATYHTPTGAASDDAPVNFALDQETNKVITVVDDKTTGTPVTLGTWNWFDGAHTFEYAVTKPGVAGTCTEYTNTATIVETKQSDTVKVTVCVGQDLTVTKTTTATFDRTYKWLIDKSVDDTLIEIAEGGSATFNYDVTVTPNGYTDSGWTIGGTITIENPNDWQDITLSSISDTLDQGGTCTITEAGPYVVPKGDDLVLHYTCTIVKATATENTVDITWDATTYHTPTGAATDDAAVDFVLDQETNKVITVQDDKTVAGSYITLGTWNWFDGPHTFEYAVTKAGVAGTCTDYTNIARILETKQSDPQTVTVCVGKDLTVEKSATATFDRKYNWLIDKSVDKTYVEISASGSATFNYEVLVSPNGYTDSGWELGGTITIANPNDWEAITLSGVTDTLDQGGTCAITEAGPYTVPASGTLTLHYTCTVTKATATKNTVDIAWNAATYFTPTGAASDDAPVTWVIDQETNKTVTVKDDKTTGSPTLLGTVDWFTGSKTFTYSLTKTGVAGTCTDYTNTAFIVETKQSDTVTVTVCKAIDSNARTMGFWQNRNGQGIIDKAGAVNGVCKVTPWLRQFAPFQDLSATASCDQVKTYVYDVIKQAEASGDSMNPMLKGQMLATALDIYFSDPALGGNKLGAPVPIGGLTIDISDWSGAFGGATEMTVMQMVTYAASQSNVGGTIWYGNDKPVQELAKNAFDAINNEWAFAPTP